MMAPFPLALSPVTSVHVAKSTGAGLLVLLLAGCVTFSSDGGMTPVSSQVTQELGKDVAKIVTPADDAAVAARVKTMLTKPLTADGAVQLALLNNRGLQADYNGLGISEAAYVEASLPVSPTISVGKLVTGASFEIERRLVASVLSLFTLPARSAIAKVEFDAARFKAVEATFRLAAETRRAYYTAVASRQTVNLLEQARKTADAAADLTIKLGETGAATKLDQARASAFYAEVSTQLAEARMREGVDREALTRLLGLWGPDINYKLPGQLPQMPNRLPTAETLEADAIRKRVDLMVARLELDAMAKSFGLTKATRFISVLDLAGIANSSTETDGHDTTQSETRGLELEVQVPIFDLGEAGVRRSNETYMQAVNRLVEKAVNVRSDVRSAYISYRATYDISWQYRNRILPLRTTIDEQSLLEYSGMLTDVFDLLTTARESIDSNIAAIAAKRDFFLASVDFQASVIGGGTGGGPEGEAASAGPAEGGGH